MARKLEKNPISLNGVRHDEIDHAAALAVMTGSSPSVPQKKGKKIQEQEVEITLASLIQAVRELMEKLTLSVSEIKRRIRRWAEKGWVIFEENGSEEGTVRATKLGTPYIQLMASNAA